MGKISLNKRIEATKLHERTGAPIAGPEVSIPFGALVESVGTDRDRTKFRYLGELYSVRSEIFEAATRSDDGVAPAAPSPAAAAVAPAREPALRFQRLDAGAYAVARSGVPGGWLVVCANGITFYPDPEHTWDGTSLQ